LGKFEKIKYDFEALGVSLGEHPASVVIRNCWPYRQSYPKELTQSDQLLTKNANQTIKVFGLLISLQAPPSAKGMVFITLEDEKGHLNLVVQPQIYRKFANTIESQSFLCITGKLQIQEKYPTILVRTVDESYRPESAKIVPINSSSASEAKLKETSQTPREPQLRLV